MTRQVIAGSVVAAGIWRVDKREPTCRVEGKVLEAPRGELGRLHQGTEVADAGDYLLPRKPVAVHPTAQAKEPVTIQVEEACSAFRLADRIGRKQPVEG